MRFCRVIVVLFLCFVSGEGRSADETDEFKEIKRRANFFLKRLSAIEFFADKSCFNLKPTVQSMKDLKQKLVFPEKYNQSQHSLEELLAHCRLLDFLDEVILEFELNKREITRSFPFDWRKVNAS